MVHDPLTLPTWSQPSPSVSDPFVLTGQDGFLYGRGASDNKGSVLAAIFAAALSRQADTQFGQDFDEEYHKCGARRREWERVAGLRVSGGVLRGNMRARRWQVLGCVPAAPLSLQLRRTFRRVFGIWFLCDQVPEGSHPCPRDLQP